MANVAVKYRIRLVSDIASVTRISSTMCSSCRFSIFSLSLIAGAWSDFLERETFMLCLFVLFWSLSDIVPTFGHCSHVPRRITI